MDIVVEISLLIVFSFTIFAIVFTLILVLPFIPFSIAQDRLRNLLSVEQIYQQ